MANTTTERTEVDSTYFLKILLFFILGSLWLRITMWNMALPIGLALGLLFASHDHFQIDRKIEYAVLLVAAIIGLIAPIGIVIEL